jgi:1-acyl-sn-glycerol-3-phosphate acyltransferase
MNAAASVLAARSPWLHWGFMHYVRRAIARSFTAVRLLDAAPTVRADLPLMVVANHPGWWDPLVFFLLNEALLAPRRLFGPMDAAALARYGVLARLGLFGIERDRHAGTRRFLEVGSGVLRAPATALWITAEGEFGDVRRRPLALKSGVAHLARRVAGVQVLPVALEYAYWNEARPEVFVAVGPPLHGDALRLDAIEAALAASMDRLASAVVERNPAGFSTLLSGRAGMGGAYDACRRVAAWCRGRAFDAAHEGAAPRAAGRP